MNETLKTIATRYTCRAYSDRGVSPDDLRAIALAAVQAPSAMNRQGWRIIVVSNPQLLGELEQEGMKGLAALPDRSSYERIMSRGGKIFYDATAMFFIAIEPGNKLDCGIVAENIALAATSLGLGSCICGMASFAFSTDKREDFLRRLGFPEGYELGMTVLAGYAKNEGGKPHEADFSKVSFIG